jgi:hypothetical protein
MRLRYLALALALSAFGTALADGIIPAPELDDGYLKLGFDKLAGFKFITPAYDPVADPKATPPSGEEQIPGMVKGWSGHKAVITGFMLPTKLDNGKAVEFLIMANQMACCFGTIPNMNEWIVVRMPKGVSVIQDVPISFYGTLTVGAMYENGYMTGIYAMDAERMGDVKE